MTLGSTIGVRFDFSEWLNMDGVLRFQLGASRR